MSLEADALTDRRRLRGKLTFWRVVAFLAALIALITGYGFATDDAGLVLSDHLARVRISGVITDNRDQQKLLRTLAENDRVKALILDIDSPGGTTTGGEALFEAIRVVADKKPVVATLGTVAASGGYIAAIGADYIVARGNTLTGSIGVVIQWPNATGLMDKVGIAFQSVKSSPIKAEPTPFTPTPPEAVAVLEKVVGDSYNWFIDLVAARRGLTLQEAKAVGDARIFTGRDAVAAKLVDEIGGETTARAWLKKTHKLPDHLKVKTYAPGDSLDRLVGSSSLIKGVAWLAGGKPLSALLSNGAALDGLVSVWHPDTVK